MSKICISCKKGNLEFLDDYKYEINKDINFLGKMKIYECQDCKLAFSYPMPQISKLEEFYTKVYRSQNRHHYYSNFDKKFSLCVVTYFDDGRRDKNSLCGLCKRYSSFNADPLS